MRGAAIARAAMEGSQGQRDATDPCVAPLCTYRCTLCLARGWCGQSSGSNNEDLIGGRKDRGQSNGRGVSVARAADAGLAVMMSRRRITIFPSASGSGSAVLYPSSRRTLWSSDYDSFPVLRPGTSIGACVHLHVRWWPSSSRTKATTE